MESIVKVFAIFYSLLIFASIWHRYSSLKEGFYVKSQWPHVPMYPSPSGRPTYNIPSYKFDWDYHWYYPQALYYKRSAPYYQPKNRVFKVF